VLVLFEGVGLFVQDVKNAASIADKMNVFLIKCLLLVNTCATQKIWVQRYTFFLIIKRPGYSIT